MFNNFVATGPRQNIVVSTNPFLLLTPQALQMKQFNFNGNESLLHDTLTIRQAKPIIIPKRTPKLTHRSMKKEFENQLSSTFFSKRYNRDNPVPKRNLSPSGARQVSIQQQRL